MNEIAMVKLSLAQPVVFEPYARSRTLGGFILIDKLSFATVGAPCRHPGPLLSSRA